MSEEHFKRYNLEVLLFDKLIDYLKYKNADFSAYKWYVPGAEYIKDEYIIKECRNLRHSKKFKIDIEDNINPENRVYPYSRFFLWYYTNAHREDRCYLNQHAVFDTLFFVFKRAGEDVFNPVAYFETRDEAENYINNL